MKESIWGYAILTLGILAVGIIWFFANTTRTDQHNYALLKETTESAMMDAVDLAYYRQTGNVRIEEEKFVENFIRRFAENADLSNEYYKIEIYDVNTEPPKVSLKVSSGSKTNATGEIVEFNIVNNIDAILETKYYLEEEEIEDSNENQYEECRLKSRKVKGTLNKYNPIKESLLYSRLYSKYSVEYIINLDVPTNSTVKDVEVNVISYNTNYIYNNYNITIKPTSSDVSYVSTGEYKYTAEFEFYSLTSKYGFSIKAAPMILNDVEFIVYYRYCY